jgi:hypothetical protein
VKVRVEVEWGERPHKNLLSCRDHELRRMARSHLVEAFESGLDQARLALAGSAALEIAQATMQRRHQDEPGEYLPIRRAGQLRIVRGADLQADDEVVIDCAAEVLNELETIFEAGGLREDDMPLAGLRWTWVDGEHHLEPI